MLVVCAGMYRSGSTWQYNCARLLLEEAGLNPQGYWEGDFRGVSIDPDKCYVVKAHQYLPKLANRATIILTAIRSVEDIVASMERMAEYLKDHPNPAFRMGADPKKIERGLRWFARWQREADYVQLYNKLISDPLLVVKETRDTLHLTQVVSDEQCKAVLEQLNNLKPPKEGSDPVTLYHAGHITKSL